MDNEPKSDGALIGAIIIIIILILGGIYLWRAALKEKPTPTPQINENSG